MRRVNNRARPEWHERATEFILNIMAGFNSGYVFLATRKPNGKSWQDHSFKLGNHAQEIAQHFKAYSRNRYDHYFCPNAFSKPQRLAQFALKTNRAWVDIDGADPSKFDPQPGILIETSPGRTQGVWMFPEWLEPNEAAQYSKALAYNFGADKTGWSVTKYLRVPFTFNHKEEYDGPPVRLLRADFGHQKRKALPVGRDIWTASEAPIVHTQLNMPRDWRTAYMKYREKLHPRVRSLVEADRAYGFEKDRSKCIYEIVADLARAGARPEEIGSILWHNPYFVSKHGHDLEKLNEELWRILNRLGVQP